MPPGFPITLFFRLVRLRGGGFRVLPVSVQGASLMKAFIGNLRQVLFPREAVLGAAPNYLLFSCPSEAVL